MEKLNEVKQALKYLEIDANAYADNFSASMIVSTKNILAIAEAFRELEQAKVSAEHERDCHMDIADYFKESWVTQKQRAEAAEAKLAELEKQEPYGYVHNVCNPPGSGVAASIFKEENRHYERPVFTRPAPAADLAELVPCCLVDAMSNLGLEGVSIGDKSIIGKAIEVLHNIQERTK